MSYDINKLKELDEVLSNTENGRSRLHGLIKPMREKLDIEAIKQEQNYQPINAEEFFKELEDLNIEEPLEDFIKIL